MSRTKGYESFFVMVVDHDKNEFSIEGPTSDESKWHEAREKAKKAGRRIDVTALGGWHSPSGKPATRDLIVKETLETSHLRHLKNVPAGAILGKYMF